MVFWGVGGWDDCCLVVWSTYLLTMGLSWPQTFLFLVILVFVFAFSFLRTFKFSLLCETTVDDIFE